MPSIRLWTKSGHFPDILPQRFGDNRLRWSEIAVREQYESRKKMRDTSFKRRDIFFTFYAG